MKSQEEEKPTLFAFLTLCTLTVVMIKFSVPVSRVYREPGYGARNNATTALHAHNKAAKDLL